MLLDRLRAYCFQELNNARNSDLISMINFGKTLFNKLSPLFSFSQNTVTVIKVK